ncbi:hypothetical protein [Wolbachia endosymbiont of Armadillidium arcangelii]|uniref:Uncharacterized protein n=1 Tax=Wolbachia endosymbiont of Armadillidium arcangelii TaxID=3158571 RepID=A0AAU7Q3K7_9RICK
MENRSFVEILFRHTGLNVNIKNNHHIDRQGNFFHTPEEYIRKIGQVQNKNFSHLTIEIQKAQKGKDLLNALSSENFYEAKQDLNPNCWESDFNGEIETPLTSGDFHEAKVLLNQDLNPNCWKRNSNGEIETPLSLIIRSCLQGITEENKKEVLTKFLKHKDLDFSQTKPIPAIEQNSRLKQIIEQAMKERLTDAINRKDLDDVKKLVEDNCFMNSEIVTALLRNLNNPIESIKNYLNEKFPANMEQPSANAHNVAPEINDEFIAQELQRLENLEGELERTKAQL